MVGPTYLGTEYTLSDARVIFELDVRQTARAAELAQDLGIDPAYLSRIIARFGKLGLLTATADPEDGRSRLLTLTARGRDEAARLTTLSRGEIAAMIESLSADEAEELATALKTAERHLSQKPSDPPAFTLRPHRPGDMGWIVESQTLFYSREYGWNDNFEALVADVAVNSSGASIRSANVCGLPNATARASAPSSLPMAATGSASCVFSMWTPQPVGSAWATVWSMNASPLPHRPDTARSASGPITR